MLTTAIVLVHDAMLAKDKLDLKKVLQIKRAAEKLNAQTKTISGQVEVNAVQKEASKAKEKKCKYGGEYNKSMSLSAWGSNCDYCNGRGHFGHVCKKEGRGSRSRCYRQLIPTL